MHLGELGEFGFLERVRSWVPSGAAQAGLGDDAAVLPVTPGASLVATTDALLEGAHFRLDWSTPADIGFKAMVVNFSDLAAMGADPRWMLLSLGAAADTPMDVLEQLYAGMLEACGQYGAELVGGDTVRTAGLFIAVTALGEVTGEPLRRSAAEPDDLLAVTGPLGLAAAGVRLLSSGLEGVAVADARACVLAHRRPLARVTEGRGLREAGVRAALDLSDGLYSDLRRLAEASGVGVEVDAGAIPMAPEAERVAGARGWDPLELAAGGGEDFELLAALPPQLVDATGVPLTVIGRVVPEGLWLLREGERVPLPAGGYEHFGTDG